MISICDKYLYFLVVLSKLYFIYYFQYIVVKNANIES